ncbi:hypothetical protein V8E36_009851 [Tilletia maclaganii]
MKTFLSAFTFVVVGCLATMLSVQQVRAHPTDSVISRHLESGLTSEPLRSRMPPINPARLPTKLKPLLKLGKTHQANMETANTLAEQALREGNLLLAEQYLKISEEASQNMKLVFDRYEQLTGKRP